MTRAENPLRRGLAEDRTIDPCAVVIFGASGDLTKRKLMPGLYNLAVSGSLSGGVAVVGVARREKSNEDFRTEMRGAISKFSRRQPIDEAVWSDFERRVSYVAGTFEDLATYERLAQHLDELDKERGTGGSRLFYLAVPSAEFGTIAGMLREAKLVRPPVRSGGGPWTRIVFEKPFGHDLASARG
jgi:glucose-6-phosphate 1-dehydrogenase